MKEQKKVFYGWWIVAACTMIMASFFVLLNACLGHFTVSVCEDLGISRSAFSGFTTVFAVTCMLLSPIAGKKCGAGNIRLFMTTGLILGIAGYFCISFVKNVAMLYVLAAYIGTCFVFCTTVPIAIVLNRWFVKAKGTAMSITFAGSSLGAMLLSPVINSLISNYGWRFAIRCFSVGMWAVLVPAVFLIIRSGPQDKGLQAYGAGDGPAEGRAGEGDESGLSLAELRKMPVFYIYIAGIFIMMLTIGIMYHIVGHITLLIDAATAAKFVSVFSFIGILGKLLMGYVFDRSLKGGLLLGTVFMALTFALLITAKSLALLIPVALFYGIGTAHSTIFPPTLTVRFFGTKHYGEVYGFVNSFVQLAMSVNGLIMAALFDMTGSYTPAWIFGLIATAAAAVLLFAVLGMTNGMRKENT